MPPQGIMSYPGLEEYLLSGQFTLAHGITPSICTIYCAPFPGKPVEIGTLSLRFGNNKILFPNCKLDQVRNDINEEGFQICIVTIFDRRWKWKFGGVVSGRWNVKRGEVIVRDTLQSARALMTLCLEAMGEKGYDVKDVPENMYPSVEWDITHAPSALAALCDILNFRVVYEQGDRVGIRRIGVGKQLPILNLETQATRTIDPPERPDELIFAGGPNRFQFDLPLEAVLRDRDGTIKPINELSYAPKNPRTKLPCWGMCPLGDSPFSAEEMAGDKVLQAVHQFIIENLFHWYRVKSPALIMADVNGKVEPFWVDLAQILPFDATLIEIENTGDGELVEKEPFVYGLWWGMNHSIESTYHVINGADFEEIPSGDVTTTKNPITPLDKGTGKSAKALYTQSFSLERETGYVHFANPVVRQWPSSPRDVHENREITYPNGPSGLPSNTFTHMEAILFLRVAFSVRAARQFGAALNYTTVKRPMPGPKNGTKPEYVRASDIRFRIAQKKDLEQLDNREEFETAAKHYLDAKQAEYQIADSHAYSYAGFQPISPDGAIQQVTWEITRDGYAYTRASRNKEEILSVASYQERRLFERIQFQFAREAIERPTKKGT